MLILQIALRKKNKFDSSAFGERQPPPLHSHPHHVVPSLSLIRQRRPANPFLRFVYRSPSANISTAETCSRPTRNRISDHLRTHPPFSWKSSPTEPRHFRALLVYLGAFTCHHLAPTSSKLHLSLCVFSVGYHRRVCRRWVPLSASGCK